MTLRTSTEATNSLNGQDDAERRSLAPEEQKQVGGVEQNDDVVELDPAKSAAALRGLW